MTNTISLLTIHIQNGVVLYKVYKILKTPKISNFATSHEYAYEDVESCFDVIEARWSMIIHPCRLWKTSDMFDVM